MLPKCTARMIHILIMHEADNTPECLRERKHFPLRFYTLEQERRLQKGETHEPY
jgi:hypothetical protein